MTNRTAGNSAADRSRAMARAEHAARWAIALDDSLADAHVTLAVARMNRGDLMGAEFELRRAMELEPGVLRHHEFLARLYAWWQRPADAMTHARRAVSIAPLSPTANAELARALLVNDSPDAALAQLDRVGQLDPPLLRVATIAAQSYDRKGDHENALRVIRPSAEQRQVLSIGLYGYLLARAGMVDSASRLLARLERENRNALNVALVHAGLGDFESSITWLERAVDDWSLTPGSELGPTVHAIFDTRRSDPRVVALRRRLGLTASP
jgi:tetratricopeptide (TPR) repeat protein